ncbi:aconitate hydratase [Acidaminobacter sp. JC074]|uniref:aconitate hydratase n=1 Tax=Acidaminobacter sp. JC074 TaxID=2530199 RepID=UPI001F0F11DB|nr:aconitate hydratase [Acidaminobacter sp. JC074]MCH4888957.1 aconitate hydratase [Acidaminobacter sp. JC074]
MGKNLTYKILENKLLQGQLEAGSEVVLKVDQTLTQDTTGTMAYLQLEAMKDVKRQTELSVAYIDHNTLQLGFENADDHEYIRSVCEKYGIIYSKAGNGICHQLHLERFSRPGIVLIGSDSHTPTSGGMGALAIGSGGLDIAIGIAKGYYYLTVPKVLNVKLTGKLSGASAKDIILTVLEKLSVKGGVGYVIEYSGPGVKTLSLTERATITNMGTELGATTSIFPSDDETLKYLQKQGREDDYTPLAADDDAVYDYVLEINLSEIEAKIACPHSPDNIKTVKSLEGLKINQVAIGSCTNSSYDDLMKVASILKGKKVHPNVSLVISPGSNSIVQMLANNGSLTDMIQAGARILEASCGPCIGMGQAPKSGGVSLRTFNRNFKGRCGTSTADVYLVSPETAAISALKGVLTSPENLGLESHEPDFYLVNDNYFIHYEGNPGAEIVRGPNIHPFPIGQAKDKYIHGSVLFKGSDNITTDDIVPSNAKLLPLRSNIPELSKHMLSTLTPDFYIKSQSCDDSILIAGENYGQGSSREHAALLPLHLGVKAIVAKSYARIHKKNLINSSILPLVFEDTKDYKKINEGDELRVNLKNLEAILVDNITRDEVYKVKLECSSRELNVLMSGGAIKYEEAK